MYKNDHCYSEISKIVSPWCVLKWDVQQWMSLSKLKLNLDKYEFIVFGSKAQHQNLSSHFPVNIVGNLLHPSDIVRNFGLWLDADYFSGHI